MQDAWRADAFELYRRLVVRDAWDDLDAGELYVSGWSHELSKRQKAGDLASVGGYLRWGMWSSSACSMHLAQLMQDVRHVRSPSMWCLSSS